MAIAPIVVPEKTYADVMITRSETLVNGDATAAWFSADLTPYNPVTRERGSTVIHLDPINMLARAQTDPDAAQIVSRMRAFVLKVAIEQGKVSPAEE